MKLKPELAECIMVWFVDPTFMNHDDIQRIKAELEALSRTVMIFLESQECIDYLNQIHDEQMVLIVNEDNGERIVRNILSFSKVHSIFILCSNPSHRPSWASICRSIGYYVVDFQSIFEKIQIESNEEYHSIAFDALSPSSSENESRNKQEATFMYGQLLKHILTHMSYTEGDMDNMIELFKEKSSNNKASQEFQKNYAPNKALLYYTTETFFYSILNTALRTCDLDIIYTMGIFIKDLHKSLVELHKPLNENEILHLYRGQIVPTKDFERIQKNVGGLLSINQFLSTSTEPDVAKIYTVGAGDHKTGVLFHITIDQQTSRTIYYANIKDYSKFKDEDEYLFTMGSVFRIDSIKQCNVDNIWRVSLSLTDSHDVQLTSLTNYYLKILKSPDLSSLSTVMFLMGEYEKVVQICKTAVKTTKNIFDLYLFYSFWGMTCFYMGQKRQALKIVEQALSYNDQLPKFHQLNSIRLWMKGLHSFMQQEYDLAVSLFQQCIDLEQQTRHPQCHHEMVAACHQMIGCTKQCQGNFSGALPSHSAAYQTMHGHLPSYHPLMTSHFQESSLCHLAIGETSQSSSLIKEAKQIGENAMLPEDPSALKSNLIQAIVETKLEYNQDSHIPPSERDRRELPTNPMQLLLEVTRYQTQKKYDEALSTIDELLRLQEQTDSLLDSDMVDVYIMQGICLLYKRDFTKAMESCQQAKHIAASIQAKLAHKMSVIHLWIAVCHAEQNDDSQAMKIIEEYRQMISNRTELNSTNIFNEEPLQWLIHSFMRRAMDDQTHGYYQGAVSKLERCLQIQQMIVPNDHLDQGKTYHVIGDCFRMMSNYSYALINYLKSLAIYEKLLLSNDPVILQLLLLIGTLHALSNQYDEALTAFIKYQRLLLTVDTPNYSELADSYQLLADVNMNQGNVVDAVTNYQRSLDIYAKHSLPVNFKTALIWMFLGGIYDWQRKNDDALIAFNTALKILISTPTPTAGALADIHEKIGIIHRRAKRYPEALSSFQNRLQTQLSFLPADHLDLAETLLAIGEMNAELNHFSDAAVCYDYAVQIQIKYLPKTTSKVITTLQNAACCYLHSSDWKNFFFIEEQVLELQLNILPANHLDIAKTYRQIGGVYHFIGKSEEALKSYLKSLDIQNATLPSDHPLLLETRAEIDDICTTLNGRHQ